MAKKTSFAFKTKLSSMKVNFISTVVIIPDEIIKKLPQGRVRTEGTLNGARFALAIQFKKDGRRFFAVSRSLRSAAKIETGDWVDVKFNLVDPDLLRLPEELEAVLEQDEEAKEVWDSFPRGLQRGLVHYISSVKNVDSRIKRSLEIATKAKLGQLHVQKLKKEKNKP